MVHIFWQLSKLYVKSETDDQGNDEIDERQTDTKGMFDLECKESVEQRYDTNH